jgi:redox-sensing transcriptional repressor
VAGKEILPLAALEQFVKEQKIKIGIITVPKVAAQDVLNKMVEAGIKAIWNFAPAPLCVPKDIVLKTEDLAASLAMLAGKLTKA